MVGPQISIMMPLPILAAFSHEGFLIEWIATSEKVTENVERILEDERRTKVTGGEEIRSGTAAPLSTESTPSARRREMVREDVIKKVSIDVVIGLGRFKALFSGSAS